MSSGYYQKNKEKLQKEAYGRYPNLSKERKNKKQKEAREKYRNFSGERKEKSFNIVVNAIKNVLKMKSKE